MSFVGAWTLYGFHEDGFTSGVRAAEKLGANIPFEIVDARYIRGKVKRGMGAKRDTWDVVGRTILLVIQWIIFTLNSFPRQKRKRE